MGDEGNERRRSSENYKEEFKVKSNSGVRKSKKSMANLLGQKGVHVHHGLCEPPYDERTILFQVVCGAVGTFSFYSVIYMIVMYILVDYYRVKLEDKNDEVIESESIYEIEKIMTAMIV